MASHRVVRGAGSILRDQLLSSLLKNAELFERAAGFFASSSFAVAPTLWREFFERGGRLLVVCSPRLQQPDVEAIKEGLTDRRKWVAKPAPTPKSSSRFGRALLSWAIANGKLHIRIATIRDTSRGLYHEKFGVVTDSGGRRTAFSGSVNETGSAYTDNFELAQVFNQEESPDLVADYDGRFARLWANETAGLEVVAFHHALALGQIEVVDDQGELPQQTASHEENAARFAELLVAPPQLELRDYQRRAIDAWFQHGGRGIYAMATGTGKTITSLATALRVYDQTGGPLVLIVVVPYLVLVDQWIETMRWFGLAPIRCAGSRQEWMQNALAALYLANRGRREVVSFVVSNATFALSSFQRVIDKLESRTMLIADEVHNFGASNLQEALPERIALRLGLSATPERHHDPEGTRALLDYFGDPAIEFGMKEALAYDPPALVPYTYMPVLVELTEDEYVEYLNLTKRIARAIGPSQSQDTLPEPAKILLLRRARLIGAAVNKLDALMRAIAPYREASHTLVYCGDGSVEAGIGEGDEAEHFARQIDAVVDLLGNKLEMRVASYTARTSEDERAALLRDFRAGRIQALVAIRCLDEGLDVPNVRRAFILASSSNPRQFIQRRGRVLRPSPSKDKAEIFDFFVAPPKDSSSIETRAVERSLVRKEMKRAVEFMRLATNTTEARHKLWDVLERLHLLDTLVGEDDG